MKSIVLLAALLFVTLASCKSSYKDQYCKVYRMKGYGLLEPIDTSKKVFYLRYDVDNLTIDIWSLDSVHYTGKLICFTVRHLKRKYKYYGINFQAEDSMITGIMRKFYELGIAEILKKDTFMQYSFGSHGDHNTFKYYDGYNYISKEHFSLKAEPTMRTFQSTILSYVNRDELFKRFINYLPNGTYQRGMLHYIKD